MKYVAIIDSADELSEDAIKSLVKNTTFADCGETPYCFEITSIKEVPEPIEIEKHCSPLIFAYNQALKDCGVLEE